MNMLRRGRMLISTLVFFSQLLILTTGQVASYNSSNARKPVNCNRLISCRGGSCEHATVTNQTLSGFAREIYTVTSLNLSDCGINGIFNGAFARLGNLQNLSLARNNIRIIDEGAFQGLKKLAFLNLERNPLQQWNGNIRKDLPQLKLLNINGIKDWKPDTRLLGINALVEIRGASWNPDCADCFLIKNYTINEKSSCSTAQEIRKGECTLCPPMGCRCTKYLYTEYTLLLARENFVYAKCKDTDQCFKSLTTTKETHPCLSAGTNLFIVQTFIGVSGLLLNTIVVANILTTPRLRRNVSLLFTGNMAFCDFLNCLYAVSISLTYLSFPSEESFSTVQDNLCPLIGCAWLLGQIGVVLTSFLMTFERHRAINFATKPMCRMTPQQAICGVLFSWVFAVGILSYALLHNFFTYNPICVPIAASYKTPHLFNFSVFLGSLASLLYLISIFLYINIYAVVKKSSRLMGVRREAIVAKSIALLVVTNMAFFILPILIYCLMMSVGAIQPPVLKDRVNILIILIPVIAPMYCFILNSCFNPFLHAFRNSSFRVALKSKCSCAVLNQSWKPHRRAAVAPVL